MEKGSLLLIGGVYIKNNGLSTLKKGEKKQ